MRSGIYTGRVMHARSVPAAHRFAYRVSVYAIDLDELGALERSTRLFGADRRAPVSLQAAGRFGDAERGLRANVTDLLTKHGIALDGGRLVLVTNLRTLGYVFNPIACFWCWRPDGALAAMIAEVSNTFGERHLYVLPADAATTHGSLLEWNVDKALHVSPFFGMDQSYRIVAAPPGERLILATSVSESGARVLHTTLTGRRRDFTPANLVASQLRAPLMPQRATALIHWEALRLHHKGVSVVRKPPFRTDYGTLDHAAASTERRGLRPPRGAFEVRCAGRIGPAQRRSSARTTPDRPDSLAQRVPAGCGARTSSRRPLTDA